MLSEFKKTFFIHDQNKSAFRLSAEEKKAKDERQKARYNRTYRAGLHERMREMKISLDVLEQKQQEYQKFKTFIDKIEDDIRKVPQVNFSKSAAPVRIITRQEVSLKLSLKADMLRELIPSQFKPDGKKSKSDFKAEPMKNSAVQIQKWTTKEISKDLQRADVKPKIRPLTAIFRKPAAASEAVTKQPAWKQPMPVRIKAVEKALAAHKVQGDPILIPKAKPWERKSWFIPATEKTRPLQKLIDREIVETKNQSSGFKKLEGKSSNRPTSRTPIKTISHEEVRRKIKQEAKIKRDRVPPQYRAEPYEDESIRTPEQEAPKEETTIQSAFKERALKAPQDHADNSHLNADDAKTDLKSPPRQKMADKFNAVSFTGTQSPEPSTDPDIDPEGSFDLSR